MMAFLLCLNRGIQFFILSFLLIPSVIAGVPIIGTVIIDDPIFLDAGGTTTIFCNSTINDTEGYQNVSYAEAVFYDSASAIQSDSDDNNDHYSSVCALSNGSGNQVSVTCKFDIEYYANPSNWTCVISAYDQVGSGEGNTSTEILELQALSANPISFVSLLGSSLALGDLSAETEMVITNLGNIGISVDISGKALNCTNGLIPLSNERYNTSSGFSYINGAPLLASPTPIPALVIPPRIDDGSPSNVSIYWLLKVPLIGIGGSCAGTIIVDAS